MANNLFSQDSSILVSSTKNIIHSNTDEDQSISAPILTEKESLKQLNSITDSKDEEEPKLAKSFPWLTQFVKLCRAEIGVKDINTLENLMTVYLKHIGSTAVECYVKPNRAAKLKRCMNNTMVLFHMLYSDIKKPLEHSSYLDKMSHLLAYYIDLEIKASRTGKESIPKIASKLTSSLYLFLDYSVDHVLDAILKTKYMTKNFNDLCSLIFKRVLKEGLGRTVYEMTYIRYILVFKMWKRVVKGAEERRKITKIAATKLIPPLQFREKLKSGLLSGVLPSIPKSRSDITMFLMQAKFCVKEKSKVFLKIVADPKQQSTFGTTLTADLDRSLFFGDVVNFPHNSNSDDQEDTSGSSMLMNDIWSSMTLEAGLKDHLRLATVTVTKTNKKPMNQLKINFKENDKNIFCINQEKNNFKKSEEEKDCLDDVIFMGIFKKSDDVNSYLRDYDMVTTNSKLNHRTVSNVTEIDMSLQSNHEYPVIQHGPVQSSSSVRSIQVSGPRDEEIRSQNVIEDNFPISEKVTPASYNSSSGNMLKNQSNCKYSGSDVNVACNDITSDILPNDLTERVVSTKILKPFKTKAELKEHVITSDVYSKAEDHPISEVIEQTAEAGSEKVNEQLKNESLKEQDRCSRKTFEPSSVCNCVSDASNVLESKEKKKGPFHDNTLVNDHSIFISQQQFRSMYITEVLPPTISVPSPPKMDSSSRCKCDQCNANYEALKTNYEKLTAFKDSKLNSACKKSQGSEDLEPGEKKRHHSSLPLKKRKAIQSPTLLKKDASETSYPCTPMMSIAVALEISKFGCQQPISRTFDIKPLHTSVAINDFSSSTCTQYYPYSSVGGLSTQIAPTNLSRSGNDYQINNNNPCDKKSLEDDAFEENEDSIPNIPKMKRHSSLPLRKRQIFHSPAALANIKANTISYPSSPKMSIAEALESRKTGCQQLTSTTLAIETISTFEAVNDCVPSADTQNYPNSSLWSLSSPTAPTNLTNTDLSDRSIMDENEESSAIDVLNKKRKRSRSPKQSYPLTSESLGQIEAKDWTESDKSFSLKQWLKNERDSGLQISRAPPPLDKRMWKSKKKNKKKKRRIGGKRKKRKRRR